MGGDDPFFPGGLTAAQLCVLLPTRCAEGHRPSADGGRPPGRADVPRRLGVTITPDVFDYLSIPPTFRSLTEPLSWGEHQLARRYRLDDAPAYRWAAGIFYTLLAYELPHQIHEPFHSWAVRAAGGEGTWQGGRVPPSALPHLCFSDGDECLGVVHVVPDQTRARMTTPTDSWHQARYSVGFNAQEVDLQWLRGAGQRDGWSIDRSLAYAFQRLHMWGSMWQDAPNAATDPNLYRLTVTPPGGDIHAVSLTTNTHRRWLTAALLSDLAFWVAWFHVGRFLDRGGRVMDAPAGTLDDITWQLPSTVLWHHPQGLIFEVEERVAPPVAGMTMAVRYAIGVTDDFHPVRLAVQIDPTPLTASPWVPWLGGLAALTVWPGQPFVGWQAETTVDWHLPGGLDLGTRIGLADRDPIASDIMGYGTSTFGWTLGSHPTSPDRPADRGIGLYLGLTAAYRLPE